jgi:uncharacterized protein YndB with AHSA1/START domain
MISIPKKIEDCSLEIRQEIRVKAPIEVTFESLLQQIGPANETHDGRPLPMKIEAWPGGRWFRDLGNENGHLWGHVQAIKRPTLLEFCGPMFASYPFNSNVQYRLSEEGGETVIRFQHLAFGFVDHEQSKGINEGWGSMIDRVKKAAEKSRGAGAAGAKR